MFFTIASPLCCGDEGFSAHEAALRQNQQLCRSLVQLLLPAVAALSVSLQLPCERRPLYATWDCAATLSSLLASDALAAARADVLGAAGAADACVRLLKATAQMVQHVPFASDIDMQQSAASHGEQPASQPNALVLLVQQLGSAAAAQLHSLRRQCAAGAALDAVQVRQQVLPLLPLLPRLAAAVLEAARHVARETSQAVSALHSVLELLLAACRPAPDGVCSTDLKTAVIGRHLSGAAPPGGTQVYHWNGQAGADMATPILAAWCGDATAALRALPLLARAAQAAQGSEDLLSALAEEGQDLLAALAELGQRCMDVANEAASDAAVQLVPEAMMAPAASVQAAFAALWRLHTAYCRAVHWAAAGGAQAIPALAARIQAQRPCLQLLAAAAGVHAGSAFNGVALGSR